MATSSISQTALFAELGIQSLQSGACTGWQNWITPLASQPIIAAKNPSTGETLASVYSSSASAYEQIITCAEAQFKSWQKTPAPKRGDLIRQLGEAFRRHHSALGALVSLEMGKAKQEGEGEIQEIIDMADFVVGQSRMLYGKSMHSERAQHRMYEQWQPFGVVGIITAFNFPAAVWAWNAFLAAVCGNTMIWKPSPKTPLTAIAIQHICNEVMHANGYDGIFNLFITEDLTLAQQLVQDTRVPLISFTGSSTIGREVGMRVAARFGRSILECGGNNALIVDESANLEMAIRACVFSAIGTAGQRCTTTRRLFLHDKIYDLFLEKLIAAYASIKIGDPLDETNHMGPLIDAQAVLHYQQAIEAATDAGGILLYGGHVLDQPGYFVEPAIVLAQNHWPIVQQETFAPILYVMRVQSLEEAVTLQNAVPQGLSSALFTRNLINSEYFLSTQGSDCGLAYINQGTSGAEIGGAFGGEKHTGGGREAGSDAWQAYMRRQTVVVNWSQEITLAQGIRFEVEE